MAILSIKVLVIGPGRGPLIDKLFNVMEKFEFNFEVDAIEKNPLCFSSLRDRNINLWNNKVNLILGDVRYLKNMKYDLVISELLGSFGCNELSPEILQQFIAGSTIMIPQNYENYLQPIYSPIISSLTDDHVERPYLVKLSSFYTMSNIQKIWKFEHPSERNTSRDLNLIFDIPRQGKINGFQGGFIANLYRDIQIGIHPELTEGYCQSWYPFLFPVSEISCKENSTVCLNVKRCNDGIVWYEWFVGAKIYNQHGKYYSISYL